VSNKVLFILVVYTERTLLMISCKRRDLLYKVILNNASELWIY